VVAEVRRLLVVFAHPDDETFICGGTLAKMAKEGIEVMLVCATKGEMGRRMGKPPFSNRETLGLLRDIELKNACEALGITHLRYLGLIDKMVEFENEDQLAGRIVRIIREWKPQVVLTFHERFGGHADHCAIGRVATLAFQRAGEAKWYTDQETDGLAPYQPERLHFIAWHDMAKNAASLGIDPAQVTTVDIQTAAREKMLAFRAHISQSQLDVGLWKPDDLVVKRFGGQEYFLQGNKPYYKGERHLFEHA